MSVLYRAEFSTKILTGNDYILYLLVFPVLWWARPRTPQDPLGCCEWRGPIRGPQEAVKAPGKLSVSPLSCDSTLALRSFFGDVPALDAHAAINLAMNREEWKNNRPSRRCCPHVGDYAEYNIIPYCISSMYVGSVIYFKCISQFVSSDNLLITWTRVKALRFDYRQKSQKRHISSRANYLHGEEEHKVFGNNRVETFRTVQIFDPTLLVNSCLN